MKKILVAFLCICLLAVPLAACSEETPAPHEHAFGEWTEQSPATCVSDGTLSRSCACGEKETQSIPATGVHSYGVDNTCTACGAKLPYTDGLRFEEIDNGNAFAVVYVDRVSDVNIVIPAYHEGKPVTALKGLLTSGDNVSELRIASIEIPATVTSVDPRAFAGCTALNAIKVAADNPVYHSAGHCLIETAAKKMVAGCIVSSIPTDGSVTAIGSYAFYQNTALTVFTVPHTVNTIEPNAFAGCTALQSVVLESNAITTDPTEPNFGYDAWTVGEDHTAFDGQNAADAAAALIGALQDKLWQRVPVETGRY